VSPILRDKASARYKIGHPVIVSLHVSLVPREGRPHVQMNTYLILLSEAHKSEGKVRPTVIIDR